MEENKTGNWRTVDPSVNTELCAMCGTCTTFCPDFCIRDGEIDYDYCKGCGICIEECPKGAIGFITRK